jgi:hypothetical protein
MRIGNEWKQQQAYFAETVSAVVPDVGEDKTTVRISHAVYTNISCYPPGDDRDVPAP